MTSADEFKRAMRHLAGGVAIVATEHDGRRAGIVATAVCSVSAEPPIILVCVNASASAHAPIDLSGRFSVNLLAKRQEPIARHFSGQTGAQGEDRFGYGEWGALSTGVPVLQDALAGFDCRVLNAVRVATHTVFFGSVEALTTSPANMPLIYLSGTYGTFSPESSGLWW